MTPARRHFERTRAAREAAARPSAGAGDTGPAATSAGMPLSDRMLMTLRGHRAALKGIQSRQKKADFKRDVLGEYEAYVDGVLAADNGGQDTVLVTVMLWRLDAGLWEQAMEIAAYAVEHGLAMPEEFHRDLPTTLIEELADAALTAPEDDALIGALDFALDLVADVDMPDEVRAKGLKALGQSLTDSNAARAAELFEAALKLDPKCGVKTELGRLRKALAAQAEGEPEGTTEPPGKAPAKGGKTAARTTTAGPDAG